MEQYQTFEISEFIHRISFEKVPLHAIEQLKKHLLDSVASLLHAVDKPTIQKLVRQINKLGEGGVCTTPVLDNVAADRAAQLYTALIRYPDFMDNYLGKAATCHPSDNIGSLLAASQLTKASGKDFLTALAIAYEIECRLVEEIPVMIKGFDHITLLAYSVTAALAKIFFLTKEQTAHALGIAGCSFNPLVTSRASYTYEWKGFASSMIAFGCMNIVLLAKEGLTGPVALFEGPKGFKEIFEIELKYDWNKEDFSLIQKCILKEYNSEVHTQSILEAALALKQKHAFDINEIENIDVTTFLTCYHIVGNGAYGDRTNVHSKEQADHSLPYLMAVALLDNQVYPEQFLPERIEKKDVQELIRKVTVHTALPFHKPVVVAGRLDPYTSKYPDKVPCKVEIKLRDGKKFEEEREDYYGFFTKPLSWDDVEKKFVKLTEGIIPEKKQQQITELIVNLEKREMNELITLLHLE